MVSRGIRGAARLAIASVIAIGAFAGSASAESVLRVAMTAADIPDYTGAPDQGYEGYRFAGYTLYDTLALWDLSSSDKAADIMPGLATSWTVDPANNKRWTYKLRQGVTFHDGCPWNADSAVWNFARVMDPKAPQYNTRHVGMIGYTTVNIASVDKIDDYTLALTTKTPNSLFPYEMAMYYMISNCAVEKAGNDYSVYDKHPYGTGPYMFDKVVPHERLELVKNPKYWNTARIPKQDRLVLLPMPEASTRAAALLSFEVGADVAAAMFALTEVPSMGAAPTVGLAARALDAAGTGAEGTDAPAALLDKTVESAAAVGAVAPRVGDMDNPGGMPGAPAAWLPASP